MAVDLVGEVYSDALTITRNYETGTGELERYNGFTVTHTGGTDLDVDYTYSTSHGRLETVVSNSKTFEYEYLARKRGQSNIP